jgi:hypothetical protein
MSGERGQQIVHAPVLSWLVAHHMLNGSPERRAIGRRREHWLGGSGAVGWSNDWADAVTAASRAFDKFAVEDSAATLPPIELGVDLSCLLLQLFEPLFKVGDVSVINLNWDALRLKLFHESRVQGLQDDVQGSGSALGVFVGRLSEIALSDTFCQTERLRVVARDDHERMFA